MSAESEACGLRVLSIIHSSAFGGPHNQAVALASALPGLDLTVVLPAEKGDGAARLRSAGVEVVEMDLRRPRASLRNQGLFDLARNYPGQVKDLATLIDEKRIDVVEVHGLLNVDGAIAARLRGCGVVWQLIDTRPPVALRWAMMPFVIALSDVIMTTGVSLAAQYPGARLRPGRQISFVPPVIARRATGTGRSETRLRLGVEADETLVVAVGNLNPQKGFDRLIEALGWPSGTVGLPQRPALRIRGAVQAGHADYATVLSRHAAAKGFGERAVGHLEAGLDIADLLGAADVFALSSTGRSEGIPTVVLEAMTHGLAVVATEVGAIKEVISDGQSGFLVAPGDTAALRQCLAALLADPARRLAVGRIAAQEAATVSSPERFASVVVESWRLAMTLAVRRARRHKPGGGAPR